MSKYYIYKLPLKKFYCQKCKKIFRTITFFGKRKINAWCRYCGKKCPEIKTKRKVQTLPKKRLFYKREFSKTAIPLKCLFCKEEFKALTKSARFCSNKCYQTFYNKNVRKKKND